MGGIASPPKLVCWHSNSSTLSCDIIQRQGLYRDSQVRRRSLGWFLIPYGWSPYTNGKLGYRQETERRDTGKRWSISQCSPRLSKARNGSFAHSLQEEPTPPTPWLWTSGLGYGETIPVCYSLLQQPYQTSTSSLPWHFLAPWTMNKSWDYFIPQFPHL